MYFGAVDASMLIRGTLQWGIEHSTICATEIVVEQIGELTMTFAENTAGPCTSHLFAHLDQAERVAPWRTTRVGRGLPVRRAVLWAAASTRAFVELLVDNKCYSQSYENGVAVGVPATSQQETNRIHVVLDPELFATTAIDLSSLASWYSGTNRRCLALAFGDLPDRR